MFKSIKTTVIALIMVSTAVIANAQKSVTEGSMTYGITYNLTPDQQSMAAQLPAETKFKFSGNLLKIEMEQGPAKITIITDGILKTGLVLVDIPIAQKQYAVKTTKEETEQTTGVTPKLTDFKATGVKEKMGVYNVEKYTYKDEKGTDLDLWVTNDIQLPAGVIGGEFSPVKGTPIKFTRVQNGITAVVTIKDVKEEKIGPLSLEVPSAYEVTTMEALRAMAGGQ